MDKFDMLVRIAKGRRKKFPQGNESFKILSRLLEEAGELAQTTNHVEGISSKDASKADKREIAKESVDVVQNVLALLIQHDLLDDFKKEIDASYEKLINDGYLND